MDSIVEETVIDLYDQFNEHMLNEFGEIDYEYYNKDVNKIVNPIISMIFNSIKK